MFIWKQFFGGNTEDEAGADPNICASTSVGGKTHSRQSSQVSVGSTGSQNGSAAVAMSRKSRQDSVSDVVVYEFYEDEAAPDFNSRKRLPAVMLQRSQISIWSILKQCIGKELSKITMPVVFNEPLSFLQRLCEYMEYAPLLRRASDTQDPVKRMEFVAAFAVSALASNWERVAKPFNPLLAETYELDRLDDLGFRFVAEQVSHHPPISAFHADSPDFKFYGSIWPKLKFWGRSIEVQPKGIISLELTKHNELYTWVNVSCSVHNLVIGKPWIEQHGKMEIVNHKNGYRCVLDFKPTSSWLGKETNHIEGFIYDKNKCRVRAMYGVWTDFLASCDIATFDAKFPQWGRADHRGRTEQRERTAAMVRNQSMPATPLSEHEEALPEKVTNCAKRPSMTGTVIPVLPNSDMLWRVNPRPDESTDFYHFTLFAMLLNELDPVRHANNTLPPTDCRYRPDMRAMEDGNIVDKAAEEKNRVEEKQRAVRKQKGRDEHNPIWFRLADHSVTKEETWQFTGEYWKRDWSRCPDIF